MKTGSGAETSGRGGVTVGNTANGIDGVGDVSVSGMLLVLTVIQRMVVLVKLPLYRRQTLRSRQEWFAFVGTHVNAPMISLNSRL
jgi:hypothetical protein